ncbi:MAG: hypothetical protein C5B46_00060 [Proteobacteria bacterium]|nr:MAG: hypothetical protein C5B46_00060 [Pseudomonadota bacterium]
MLSWRWSKSSAIRPVWSNTTLAFARCASGERLWPRLTVEPRRAAVAAASDLLAGARRAKAEYRQERTMGLLDGLVGGAIGAEMVTVVNGLIEKHGGIQGLVSQFEQQGLGATVRSWVGTGANQPISPDQVHQAIGPDTMKQLAAKFGMSSDELAKKLSSVLPQAVDHMTPEGKLPTS